MHVSIFFAVALVFLSAGINLAAHWPDRHPRTAEMLARLGFVDPDRLADQSYRALWSDDTRAKSTAVGDAERALVSDCASAYRWCDLAEALVEAGPTDKAKYCFHRAIELAPNAPHILMRASNGYFRLDDPKAALRAGRQILALVPDYDNIVFSTYLRMGVPIADVVAEGLPVPDPRPLRSFLLYLLENSSIEDARTVWASVESRGALTDPLADRFVGRLVEVGQYDLAARTWASYLGPRADAGPGGHLLNGSFEHAPNGETFDWRIADAPGVHVERDPTVAYAGAAALKLHFDRAGNLAYHHVQQTIVLPPGAYRLEGRICAADITTDQGIALRLADAVHGIGVQTPDVRGTTGWTQVAAQISVSPPSRLMNVQVVRDASEKFDSAISGVAWIDDVKVVRLH